MSATERPCPFLLHGWLTAWWTEFCTDESPTFVVVRRGGRIVGVLPLAIENLGPVRVGRIAGIPTPALADVLVAADEELEAVLGAVIGAVRALPLDVLDIDAVAAGSLLATVLPRLTRARVVEGIASPSLEMASGWDAAYRAATTSRSRNAHSRRLKAIAREGSYAWTYADQPEAIAAALDEAERIHALRWAGKPDGSAFATARGRSFQRAALIGLAAGGRSRILVLRFDDVAVAFVIELVVGRTAYVYRLAFDPAAGRFSPGMLTVLEGIRWASELGARRVEFLRGDERYKLELADRVDTLRRVIVAIRSRRGRAYALVLWSVAEARVRVRRNERARRASRAIRARLHRLRSRRS